METTLLPLSRSDDGLVDLPSPNLKKVYSDKASQAEMTFAGQYLNLAGLVLLSLGVLSYIRTSGITQKAASSGLLPCLLGVGLGLFLSWCGERLYRQGGRHYALPLIAAGIAILTVTVGAAHFSFHLLPMAGLALAIFAIMTWAGLAALRYDSSGLGGCLLAAMLGGPLLMGFPLGDAGGLLVYLLAINLATTVVVFRKKWDGFLIASLAGSYVLYFHERGLSAPWSAMLFLGTTYTLFLISGNLFHFVKRTSSDFDLGLSMVNPLLFACVSYVVLWQLPNSAALAIFTAIAAIHGGLAAKAASMKGQGEAYREMVQANLALAILFSTAAVSFLTYCSNSTDFFALVTGLWMAQGFVLLAFSRKVGPALTPLLRRGSYGAMTLAAIELAYVVPSMEQPIMTELLGMLALLGYFLVHELWSRAEAPMVEERLFANFVLAGAAMAGHFCCPLDIGSVPGLLLGAAFVPLTMALSFGFASTLRAYRYLSAATAMLVTVVALLRDWPQAFTSSTLLLMAALVGTLTPLCWRRPEVRTQAAVGGLLAASLLVRAFWIFGGVATVRALTHVLDFHAGSEGTLLWCLLSLGLLRCGRGLDKAALVLMYTGFLKSITFDANFVFSPRGIELTNAPDLRGLLLAGSTIFCYGLAARWTRHQPEIRNYYSLFGLLIFSFQTTLILNWAYGTLDDYQVILSGFWAASSLLFVAYGIHGENKLFRLFGLVVLVSCVLKMYAVDIWVLNSYSRTGTTLVFGALLMVVSFLYQTNRARLEGACPA